MVEVKILVEGKHEFKDDKLEIGSTVSLIKTDKNIIVDTGSFLDKDKIIGLICKIEERRNILCYGKQRSALEIRGILDYFNELKDLFESRGLKWN